MAWADLFRTQGDTGREVRAHYVTPSSLSGITIADAAILRNLGVSRDLAMSVPSVAACRNLIAGAVSQLVVSRSRGTSRVDPGLLLTQPDPSATWATTIAQTVDDLIFHGSAAWLVLRREPATDSGINPGGLPVRARRIPRERIAVTESKSWTDTFRRAEYRVDGTKVDPADVIWFDAGHDGVLTYGARAIAQAYEIEAAARRLAAVELPAGILQNTGHELGPDEAADVVTAFQQARQTNTVALLQNVEYQRTDLNAHDLQLVEARAISATEIARLFGVPVTLIGASPTGNASALLYSNLAQNTAQFVQQAVGPVLAAIEQTLSLDTVTPRGQVVRFEVGAFLRTDPDASVSYATQLVQAGVITADEARSYLGIPPQGDAAPDMTPGRV